MELFLILLFFREGNWRVVLSLCVCGGGVFLDVLPQSFLQSQNGRDRIKGSCKNNEKVNEWD